MNFLTLRKKFINKFLIDGKKYNSFQLLNNIFYFLNLENKKYFTIFNNFFLIIIPLFHIEKIINSFKFKQKIVFLPKKKRIRIILDILKEIIIKIKPTKNNNLSNIISLEIYNSFFKTSTIYNTYKLQNQNFLKLKNNSDYKWGE